MTNNHPLHAYYIARTHHKDQWRRAYRLPGSYTWYISWDLLFPEVIILYTVLLSQRVIVIYFNGSDDSLSMPYMSMLCINAWWVITLAMHHDYNEQIMTLAMRHDYNEQIITLIQLYTMITMSKPWRSLCTMITMSKSLRLSSYTPWLQWANHYAHPAIHHDYNEQIITLIQLYTTIIMSKSLRSSSYAPRL